MGWTQTQTAEKYLSSTEGASWDQTRPEGVCRASVLLLCGSAGWERLQGSSDLVGDVLGRACEQVTVRLFCCSGRCSSEGVVNEWVEEEPGSFLRDELKSLLTQGGM